MATQVQNRRGTTAEHSTFTGANGELTVDTTKRTLVVHDGATAGGRPLLREDQSNLPTSAPTTGIYNASGSLAISTGGSGRLFVTSAGDVCFGSQVGANDDGSGISIYNASFPRLSFRNDTTGNTVGDGSQLYLVNSDLYVTNNENANLILRTDSEERLRITSTGTVNIVGAGSAGSTQAVSFNGSAPVDSLVIDSSGRLLVGTSSAQGNSTVTIEQTAANSAPLALRYTSTNDNQIGIDFYRSRSSSAKVENTDPIMRLDAYGYDGSAYRKGASIEAIVDAATSAGDMPCRLVFSTTADGASSPTERMRIYNSGETRFVSAGSAVGSFTTAAAGTTVALFMGRHSATAGNPATGTDSIYIWSNGNIQNTNNSYGAISDIKLKENIVDANSQWSDIKALQVRKYNFKEGQTHTQIGLVAQEVELVSPGLVTESPDRDAEGNDLGTVTKSVNYSVLYMKAVKALQEAMERIETLEAKVAALETK